MDPLGDALFWGGAAIAFPIAALLAVIGVTIARWHIAPHGIVEATNGNPDFYVAFYVGLDDRYDLNHVGYGLPVFHRGFRTGWWGWPRGYDVWAVPYTESTVIVDVIDAHTNQLVWRGYDTDTLNTKNPDKTLTKAVDNVLSRFYHDAKDAQKHAA